MIQLHKKTTTPWDKNYHSFVTIPFSCPYRAAKLRLSVFQKNISTFALYWVIYFIYKLSFYIS